MWTRERYILYLALQLPLVQAMLVHALAALHADGHAFDDEIKTKGAHLGSSGVSIRIGF